jgi:hypothetical protein
MTSILPNLTFFQLEIQRPRAGLLPEEGFAGGKGGGNPGEKKPQGITEKTEIIDIY